MQIEPAELYEEFVRVRQEAVELTDRYRDSAADRPEHDLLWQRVVRRTEAARVLLETWLESDPPEPDAPNTVHIQRQEALAR